LEDRDRGEENSEEPNDVQASPPTDEAEPRIEEGARSVSDNPGCLESERRTELASIAAFVLRTTVEGWKQSCAEVSVLPFLVWQSLPGFTRFQHALTNAENAPIGPIQYLHWVNENRPAGMGKITELAFTSSAVAADCENLYRDRARWWGG
jgi:hypothetical protein